MGGRIGKEEIINEKVFLFTYWIRGLVADSHDGIEDQRNCWIENQRISSDSEDQSLLKDYTGIERCRLQRIGVLLN